jgi:contractile injection system tube protein
MAQGRMVKARLEEVGGSGRLEFKFNPAEYSVKKTAKWQTSSRSMNTPNGGRPEYLGSDAEVITLQIMFDEWEETAGDVSRYVDTLFEWCAPSRSSTSSERHQPPELKFIWGSNAQLAANKFYLESVTAKYTMFKSDGTPLRATADISLKATPDSPAGQNPTSGSIHARGTHSVSEGDTLQSIAYHEYGNANLWRGLASFNQIDDPLRLSLGSRLLLPSTDEVTEGSKGR